MATFAAGEEALGGSDKKSIEAVRLTSAPIEPSWVVAGAPRARCAELSRSRCGGALTVVWDCTAGDFDWTYTENETVHILEGEAIIDDGTGKRTIRPGDVFLFPAGSTFRWRVPVYVKKLAFLHVPIPPPAFLAVRVMRKLGRIAGAVLPPWGAARPAPASSPFAGLGATAARDAPKQAVPSSSGEGRGRRRRARLHA
jgi:uncharacterized protein